MKLLFERPHGNLPSNTKANPHEYLKAITLRSGKEVGMGNERVMEREKELEIKVSKS